MYKRQVDVIGWEMSMLNNRGHAESLALGFSVQLHVVATVISPADSLTAKYPPASPRSRYFHPALLATRHGATGHRGGPSIYVCLKSHRHLDR